MPSYLLLYRGPPGDAMSAPPEQQKAVMDAWTSYFAKHGKAIKDGGNPTINGFNAAGKGGKALKATDVTGYSMIEAKDAAAAKKMLKDHPHLMDSRNSIDVFEIMPIPGM